MSIAHENVKARYQQIAHNNAKALEDSRQKVFAAMPVLKKIDADILQANLDILESGFNKALDREALIKQRNKLTHEKQALLKKGGFNANALELTYACEACKDTGVTQDAKRCVCYNRYLLEERIKDSGLPENSGTFEAFKADVFSTEKGVEKFSQRQYMLGLKERCEKYAKEALTGEIKNLVLMGNAGTGKSYLAQAVVSRMLQNGQLALYTTANRLFSAFHSHRMGEAVDLVAYYDVPLLTIDDLGTEVMTKNVTIEYFYNLINERQTRNRATVIATNLNPEGFVARYGDRIYSRLYSKESAKYLIPLSYRDIRK